MKISPQHLLEGSDIEQIACPKNSEKFKENLPDTIVIHYTAGRSGLSSAKYLAKNNVQASAHIVIDRSGKIFQLVAFDTIAWHAGKSKYGNRKGLNRYSIGIELDNAGILQQTGDRYLSWFGKQYPPTEVVKAKHRNEHSEKFWHTYTEEQLARCYELCELLIETYGIRMIVGHEEIAPGRKQDPGPAFPLDKFRNNLLYNNRKEQDADFSGMQAKVAPAFLNIRNGPGTKYETIAPPLPGNQKVEILDERYGWYKVKTEINGWVKKEYLKFE